MKIIVQSVNTAEFVNYLASRLSYVEFVFDRRRDAMDTYLRALKAAGDGPSLHMEEDIILTVDFEKKVQAVIDSMPDKVIQFFSMRKADQTEGSRRDRNFSMNQCTYLPGGYARELIRYSATWMGENPEHPTGYDIMLNDWLRSRKEWYWIHVPSLVQHRDGKSQIDPRRSSKRQSKTFVDPWL